MLIKKHRIQSATELLPVLIDITSIQKDEEKGELSVEFLLRRLLYPVSPMWTN